MSMICRCMARWRCRKAGDLLLGSQSCFDSFETCGLCLSCSIEVVEEDWCELCFDRKRPGSRGLDLVKSIGDHVCLYIFKKGSVAISW